MSLWRRLEERQGKGDATRWILQITESRRYSTASFISRCNIVAARGWHQTQRGSWRKREVAASGKSIVNEQRDIPNRSSPTPSHRLARGRSIFIKDTYPGYRQHLLIHTTRVKYNRLPSPPSCLHVCDRDSVSGFLNRRKTKEDREGLGEIPKGQRCKT